MSLKRFVQLACISLFASLFPIDAQAQQLHHIGVCADDTFMGSWNSVGTSGARCTYGEAQSQAEGYASTFAENFARNGCRAPSRARCTAVCKGINSRPLRDGDTAGGVSFEQPRQAAVG